MSTNRSALASRAARMFAVALVACSALTADGQATRTFEFETTEATQPAITVAADGRSLVFNLVGHLFRLPAAGGAATQLTFGPYYDSEPSFSPDGARLAFVSNRDGSDGNIFVMEIASGKISQVTREYQTGAPVWRPDGKTIAYVSYLRREEYPFGRTPGFGGGGAVMGTLSTIPAQGGEPRRFGAARTYGAIFYLPDGRL
ncbi:MAG: TolB family protein, partial [Blastocatellia bacterium]